MAEGIDYEAVLTDIDERIAKLQATREGILAIIAMGGGAVPTGLASALSGAKENSSY